MELRMGRVGLGTSLGAGIGLLLGVVIAEAQQGMNPGEPGATGLSSAAVSIAAAPSQSFQFGNAQHAAAGTGMRNMGSGTVRLRGIPNNALVLRAFLYFGMICETGGCPATVDGEFEGRTITLSQVGTAANPCWGTGSIAAYRADVTGLMPSTSTRGSNRVANGDYQLSGFPSAERTGSTPWQGTPARPLAEGATLLVIYRHASTPSGSRVYIHEGVESLLGANAVLTNTLALSPAGPAPVSTAILTRFGADGQTGEAPAAFPDLTGEKTYVGPSPAALTQIAGSGSTRDLDSDWNGADGGPIAQLWDTRTTDVTGLIPSGASSYAVRYTTGFDCLTAIGYVLQLEGGGD